MKNLMNKRLVITVMTVVISLLVLVMGIVQIVKKNSDTVSAGQNDSSQQNNEVLGNTEIADNNSVSGEGTVVSGTLYQLYDLDLSDGQQTGELIVDKAFVSNNDIVNKGDKILKLTEESYTSAKNILENAVTNYKTEYEQAKLNYESGIISAKTEYDTSIALKETAVSEYNDTISKLASAVVNAKNSLNEAQSLIAQNPGKITSYENNISSYTSSKETATSNLLLWQNKYNDIKKQYDTAKKQYEEAKSEYEKIETVYEYISKYSGNSQNSSSEVETTLDKIPSVEQTSKNQSIGEPQSGSQPEENKREVTKEQSEEETTTEKIPTNETTKETTKIGEQTTEETNKGEEIITLLLEQLKQETEDKKKNYETKKSDFELLEKSLWEAETNVNTYQSKVTSFESKISDANSEISKLQTELDNAKSKLSSFENTYANAAIAQTSDSVAAKGKYDESMLSYNNAKNTYEKTISALKTDKATAGSNYNKAKEKLAHFNKSVSKGYILAESSGELSSVGYAAGNVLSSSVPIVTYADTKGLTVTITVDQSDISKIAVGDSCQIISQSGGRDSALGIVSIIGNESVASSASKVEYNVTITLDSEQTLFESGSSVTVNLSADNDEKESEESLNDNTTK